VFATPGKQKEVIAKLASSEEEAAGYRKVVKQRMVEATRLRNKSEAKLVVTEEQYSEIKGECVKLEDSLSEFTVDVSEWKKAYRALKDRLCARRKNEGVIKQKIQKVKHLTALKDNLDALREMTNERVSENEMRIGTLEGERDEFPDTDDILIEHEFRTELERLEALKVVYRQAEANFKLKTRARHDALCQGNVSAEKLAEYATYSDLYQPQINGLDRMIAFIEECSGEKVDIKRDHLSLLNDMCGWDGFIDEILGVIETELRLISSILDRLNGDIVMECPKCKTSLQCIDSKLYKAKKSKTSQASGLSLTLIPTDLKESKLSLVVVSKLQRKYRELESMWRSRKDKAKILLDDKFKYSELSYSSLTNALEEAKLELGLEKRRQAQLSKKPEPDLDTERKKKRYLKAKTRLVKTVDIGSVKRGYRHESYAGVTTSELDERVKRYIDWKMNTSSRDTKISVCELDIFKLKKTLKKKEDEYRLIPKVDESLESLQKRHGDLVKSIQGDEVRYREKVAEKEKVKTYIELCDLKVKAESLSTELNHLNKDLDSQLQEEANLTRLRSLIDQAETISISNVVHTINTLAQQYLTLMFDEPINVELSAITETLKGKVKYSPSVNIMYRGSQYSSVHELSGGEQDRISLAFILAVNEMTRSKILMLDECLSSISSSQNSLIVKGLESFARRQPILVVQHNGVEGVFDSVIQV
jgi:energy-coupling factor transporter ATP-binding protein EcfA2